MESVPQDLAPGREVMRISATDIDDGNNSIVVYDLEPRAKEDDKYFHIDKNTGVIFLDKIIDVRFFKFVTVNFIKAFVMHVRYCLMFTELICQEQE